MRSVSTRPLRRALTPATVALGLVLGTAVVTSGLTGSVPAAHADTEETVTTTTAPVLRAVGYVVDEPIAEITAESTAALTDATAVLGTAADVVADVKAEVAASDLDLGDVTVAIDTSDLRDLAGELRVIELTPALFIPHMTDETVAETEQVRDAIDSLQKALTDAKAKKAAEEAAKKKAAAEAKAKAEREAAEKAAAAERAAAQRSTAAPAPTSSGSSNYSGGDARAIARDMLAQRGWGDDQFQCLDALWSRESGWNYQAHNSSSGAYGIPQALPGSKMASAGSDWQTNPATQIKWGLGYIDGRYGTPCGAWNHSQSHGWY
ncbi:lytic transglycosylase domain-containing protein [Microbacterium invictum]|uniref:Lytic transglycosylase domain-containing protein n=1 Tax=Microbacterium invictum TaxID=515415 RepID=A0AA40VP55_9MICO|nr:MULTISPECIES: lytic transglycosylase domain-containing protein [Microbacterium]MBB4141499.1 hypothetical protein [Microbacterium invictum]